MTPLGRRNDIRLIFLFSCTGRPELARPATTLYQHNLTGILETAIRATNAQYDNAEILKRLDVRLLEVTIGQRGAVSRCPLRRLTLPSSPAGVPRRYGLGRLQPGLSRGRPHRHGDLFSSVPLCVFYFIFLRGSDVGRSCVRQVFTRECMGHYLRVFNFLWRAKRMEYTLTDIWKGQMCNAKLLKTMPGV